MWYFIECLASPIIRIAVVPFFAMLNSADHNAKNSKAYTIPDGSITWKI
jgi:hypothetical protein